MSSQRIVYAGNRTNSFKLVRCENSAKEVDLRRKMSWYLFWIYLIRFNRFNKKRKRSKKSKAKKRNAKKRENHIELQPRDVPDGRMNDDIHRDAEFIDAERNAAECGDNDSDSDDSTRDQDEIYLKRPTAYVLLEIWSFIETFVMLILFFVKNANHPDNFLNGFCSNGNCVNTIKNVLGYRMAASVLMAIGSHTVRMDSGH